MPWLAFKFDDKKITELMEQFALQSIPTLLVFDKNGNLISNDGRNDVVSKGPTGYDKWVSKIK